MLKTSTSEYLKKTKETKKYEKFLKLKNKKHHKVQIGVRKYIAVGLNINRRQDFYHICLTLTWGKFLFVIAFLFILLNLFFAFLYSLEQDGIANLYNDNFIGYFFFSVETMATVGYGGMHPLTFYSHLISTIEVFVGILFIAIVTGLIFVRFSRPISQILFSNSLVISKFNNQDTLMLRIANAKHNFIADAKAKVHILLNERTFEGQNYRRIYDMELIRRDQPLLFLTWSIMHPINPNSPLYGLDRSEIEKKGALFFVRITGFDENISKEINVRKIYTYNEIRWGHSFVDVFETDEEKFETYFNYDKFHETELVN